MVLCVHTNTSFLHKPFLYKMHRYNIQIDKYFILTPLAWTSNTATTNISRIR
jgi:hypothetical protein